MNTRNALEIIHYHFCLRIVDEPRATSWSFLFNLFYWSLLPVFYLIYYIITIVIALVGIYINIYIYSNGYIVYYINIYSNVEYYIVPYGKLNIFVLGSLDLLKKIIIINNS